MAMAVALCAVTAGAARAESAWVRGGIRLNLRTEPGTQFRIIGVVKTGDGVEILEKRDEWTQIRTADDKTGWIPVGYLLSEPPPTIRLQQLEAEAARLREELEISDAAAARLGKENAEIAEKDQEQLAEITRLTRENLELRAGARWPEWIVGASVLAAGMLIGAVLHRNATRRPSSRIRL
jgi:SH3 domain protein